MRSTRVLYVDFRVDRVTLHQRFRLQSREQNWLRKRIAADESPFMAGESIVDDERRKEFDDRCSQGFL